MHYGIVWGERQRVFPQDFPLILWEYSLSFPPYRIYISTGHTLSLFPLGYIYISSRHTLTGHFERTSTATKTTNILMFRSIGLNTVLWKIGVDHFIDGDRALHFVVEFPRPIDFSYERFSYSFRKIEIC